MAINPITSGAFFSLRLGHVAALTCPRHVIHYRAAASLPLVLPCCSIIFRSQHSFLTVWKNRSHMTPVLSLHFLCTFSALFAPAKSLPNRFTKMPVSSAAAICFAFISLHPYFRLSSASSSPDMIAGRLRHIFSSSQSHQLSRLSFSIVSSSKRLRIGFAGVPPTMV